MPSTNPDPNWTEVLGGFVVVLGLFFVMALAVDTCGDVIKNEVERFDTSHYYPQPHSVVESLIVIVACAILIYCSLSLMERLSIAIKMERPGRIAVLAAVLAAPLFQWQDEFAKYIEKFLNVFR